jgi:leader peptidase (prepilin peptidase)/N-methyltransferase
MAGPRAKNIFRIHLLPDNPTLPLLGAGTSAVLRIGVSVLRGRDRAAPMPFGPYLAAAGWLAMLYADELVDGYPRISGLRH